MRLRVLTYRIAFIATAFYGSAFLIGTSVAQELPQGDGRDAVEGACTSCHGPTIIISQRHSQEEWNDIVSKMVGNGATLTDDQFAAVVKYLSTMLGPAAETSTTAHAVPPAALAPVKH